MCGMDALRRRACGRLYQGTQVGLTFKKLGATSSVCIARYFFSIDVLTTGPHCSISCGFIAAIFEMPKTGFERGLQ